jgi:hypothetical protein
MQNECKISLPKELGIKLIRDASRIERLDLSTILFNFKLDASVLRSPEPRIAY